jgi:hypothetical protein
MAIEMLLFTLKGPGKTSTNEIEQTKFNSQNAWF